MSDLQTRTCKACLENLPASAFKPKNVTCRYCLRSKYYKKLKTQRPESYMWIKAKARAATAGMPFDIELSDIVIPTHCPYLGIELKVSMSGERYSSGKPDSPSLDRIDSSKGYVKGNVEVISFRANSIKSNLSLAQVKRFFEYALKTMS